MLGSKLPAEKIDEVTFYVVRQLAPAVQELLDVLRLFTDELTQGRLEFGPPGPTGAPASLRTGPGVPAVTLGNDGDMYWDATAVIPPTWYKKVTGTWIAVV